MDWCKTSRDAKYSASWWRIILAIATAQSSGAWNECNKFQQFEKKVKPLYGKKKIKTSDGQTEKNASQT